MIRALSRRLSEGRRSTCILRPWTDHGGHPLRGAALRSSWPSPRSWSRRRRCRRRPPPRPGPAARSRTSTTCASSAGSPTSASRTTTAPAGSSPPSARSSPRCCRAPGSTSRRTTWPTSRGRACASRGAPRAPSRRPTSPAGRARCWSATTRIPVPGTRARGCRAVRHVQEVLFLPPHGSPLANSAIKWAVMKYGAVDATMAYEHYDFNAATSAYYSRGTDLDHHVCIVGWNDAYPAGALPAPPARPGRLSHQEQLGHHLRAGRLLLDLLLRPLARDDAHGVQRRRGRRQPRRHLPARRAGLVEEHRLPEHDGVVRRPVHERRRRQRHRRELLHGQAGRDLRGPRRADAGRRPGGAGGRQRHARRRRLPHRRPDDPGGGDGRRRLRGRRPSHHARAPAPRSRSSTRSSCWRPGRPSRARSSAATA